MNWNRGGPPIVLVALLALGLPGTAGSSNDPCTQTLSNAGTAEGSSVRDVICGTTGNDTLRGRGGGDELRGFSGRDLLNGGIGNDEMFGGADDDELYGESGNDRLNGSLGDDIPLDGGSGNDVIVGGRDEDTFLGGDGDDTLLAREGEADFGFRCGAGNDSVDLDLLDAALGGGGPPIPGLFAAQLALECEKITVGAVNEGPNVVISRRRLRVGADGRATVRVACPSALRQPPRCAGRLRVQLATRRSLRRKAPTTRYSVRPGRSRRVRVRLSRRDRAGLLRRGRAQGAVTSVETGQHGQKTSVKTVGLRARR